MSDEQPDPKRAVAALEWAAVRAQGAAGPHRAPPVRPQDYRAAAGSERAAIRAQLDRVLLAPEPEQGLDALLECGALAALLPEVQELVGFSDGEWRHKDVWKHTKQVVAQAESRLALRWAALLHDVGKVKTRSIAPDGRVHFLGHAETGARILDKMEQRLGLFGDERELRQSIRFLILHHLRASQYGVSWTDSAVRRFAREMGGHLEDLLCLARADITTKRPERRRQGLQQIDALQARISLLAAEDAKPKPLPTGMGDVLMSAFGLPPSRKIGDMMRALEAEIRAGRLPAQREPAFYLELVKRDPQRYGLVP
ncbi:MAG: HD domain-containing protein [Deltaproteobacteria bacterium]|nr:HD domain-containing protein [Deltaproteobacteria bacterium]